MSNPIKTTSRDYDSLMVDINNDPKLRNRPEWFKRMIAGIGDSLNTMLDLVNNESMLDTAQSRTAIADKLALIDYYLSPPETCSGTAIFFLNPATVAFPVTFPASDLVATTQGTTIRPSQRFEARDAVTISALVSENFTVAGDDLTVAREYMTGEKVRLATSGTLPPPLAVATDYYVVKVDATTINLAETLDDAISGTIISLTGAGAGTQSISLYSFQATLYQQETISSSKVGDGDGTDFQEVDLPDENIIADTVVATVNAATYTRVTSFASSVSTDNVFQVIYRTDGTAFLRFGGNGFGNPPGLFDIFAEYAIGGGADTNISDDDIINTYAGGNADISGVTNTEDFTGGADEESTETAKRIAPLSLAARDRFVKTSDGIALVISNFSVSTVQIIRNAYGPLSCNVLPVPNGGGLPSGALKTAIEDYLIARTVLEGIDVRCNDPDYVVKNVVCGVKMKTGYTYADIEDYVKLAWRLLLSETGQEIKDNYDGNGVESAVTLINSIFTTTYGSADYTAVARLLDNFSPAEFEMTMTISDAYGLLDSFIVGVDYVTITGPVFPFTLNDDQITQVGTLTISEIV